MDHWGMGVEIFSKKNIYQEYKLCNIWVLLLLYQSVSLKESYVILQIPGSFKEGEEINGYVHKKSMHWNEKATEGKTQYVCF